MEDLYDLGEILYQKFLLDIYRHCERVNSDLGAEEKEKMAEAMVDFVGRVVVSLEDHEPFLAKASKDPALKKLAKLVAARVERDDFSRSVLQYYATHQKLPRTKVPLYLTAAVVALLAKGRRIDAKTMEAKIKRAHPRVFRTASLLSPAVFLHEKLLVEDKDVAAFDMASAGYIG